jgi:hypothetical protein
MTLPTDKHLVGAHASEVRAVLSLLGVAAKTTSPCLDNHSYSLLAHAYHSLWSF